MKSAQSDGQRPCYRYANLQIVFGVTLIYILGFTSITPALPRIAHELNVSGQDIGLLISVFSLPGIFLAPILGVLSDRFGRKKILVPMLWLFGIAGTACAFARDFGLLLVLRFFQGMGMSSLFPLGATIIGDLYCGKERILAMGYNISFYNIGAAIFPAIGGALAVLGWYYPFLISVVSIPVGFLVLFSLKNPEPKGPQRLRYYLRNAWQNMKKFRVIVLSIVIVVLQMFTFGAFFTYFPLFVGDYFNASSLVIGIIVASMSVAGAITSSQIRRLARVYTEKNLIATAFIFSAIALVIIPLMPNIWMLLIPTIFFGLSQGIAWPSILTLFTGSASTRNRGALMSAYGIVSRVGTLLGPILMGTILGVWGMSSVFFISAGLSVVMLLLVVITVK